jgi:1-acyl-sn-glycerol-3-phosphate acyltransferase
MIANFPHLRRLLRSGKWREAHLYRSRLAPKLLHRGGMKLEVIKKGEVDLSRTCIICANHSSYLDIPVLCAAIDHYFGFIGKAELTDLPIAKTFFNTIDIPVAREDSSKSAVTFKRSMQALKEGRSLVIFPEGGIMPDSTKVKPLKEGAFQLAVRLKIPILVIGLPDNYKRMNEYLKSAESGRIRVILHPLLEPVGCTADELKQKVHNMLQQDINKYLNED